MINVDLYTLVLLLSVVVFAVMGLEICFKRIPSSPEFGKLRMIRRHLAIAYMLMAVFSLTEFCYRDTYNLHASMFYTVSSAAYQIVFLSGTLTTVINPAYSTVRRLLSWLGLSTAWVLSCGIALYCFDLNWAAYAAWTFYIAQLAAAILLFKRKYDENRNIVEAIDKNHEIRFRWIDQCLAVAIALGLAAAVFAWLPSVAFLIYSVICVMGYMFLSSQFSVYSSRIFRDYYPILTETGLTDAAPETVDGYNDMEKHCREKVDSWVARKGFCDPDPDRDSAAEKIGLDKADLQWYFSVCLKTEFRSWRVKLRIEEAKDTLLSNPDAPINELAKSLGFVSKTNFYTHFKRIVGETTQEFVARHHGDVSEKTV